MVCTIIKNVVFIFSVLRWVLCYSPWCPDHLCMVRFFAFHPDQKLPTIISDGIFSVWKIVNFYWPCLFSPYLNVSGNIVHIVITVYMTLMSWWWYWQWENWKKSKLCGIFPHGPYPWSVLIIRVMRFGGWYLLFIHSVEKSVTVLFFHLFFYILFWWQMYN